MKHYTFECEQALLLNSNWGTTLTKQLNDTLIETTQVLKLNIFTPAKSQDEFNELKILIDKQLELIYGQLFPAYSIVTEPPTKDDTINTEIIYLESGSDFQIEYKSYQDHQYTLVKRGNDKTIFSGGISFNAPNQFLFSVQKAFDFAEQLLDAEEMTFSNVIRQWNYIEDLLAFEKQAAQSLQRYQIFNEVRSYYFDPSYFKNGFPAATGIGCQAPNITIDFVAINTPTRFGITPIKSPIQEDAYNYTERVLEGDALNQSDKCPPYFERATKVNFLDKNTIFVSGTAAISGEDTIASSDIEEQTQHTIENIKALISKANLEKNGIDSESHKIFQSVRTYIKNKKDAQKVEQIVKQLLPSDNYIFVLADVCRDNLLVEIEGIVTLEN